MSTTEDQANGEFRDGYAEIGDQRLRRVLKALRIPSAPKRHTNTTWRQFLHVQAATILATDFLPRGLRNDAPAAVLLVRDRSQQPLRAHPRGHRPPGRPVDHAADPQPPDGPRRSRHRLPVPGSRPAGQFTDSSDAVLAAVGIQAVKIPPRSPRAIACAQRFVLTARTEITDRMLIFTKRHLRLVLAEYEAHYNGQRPYRSRQLRPPRPAHLSQKQIKRRPVLGGPINEYERTA
jgi:putative transposase